MAVRASPVQGPGEITTRGGIQRLAGLWHIAALTLLALWLAAPASAQIQGDQNSQRLVTIAARECTNYTDIRANKARNNIQESLQDLGADTLYESNDPVDPVRELAGQPRCRPITGFTFTLGDGIGGPVENTAWGSLSIVTDPDQNPPVTEASVPLRDWDGNAVGDTRIAGAVTVGLTDEQIKRSGNGSLWVQGGTTTDPVLFNTPPFRGKYGFGALRCAVDGLNGDNVETVAFASGARHEFCYAYYVTPPPASGKIVIRKQVEGSDASETFTYAGNVSYNEGGVFSLSARDGNPGSEEFVRGETRAGDDPWTVTEDRHDGWTLTSIVCDSRTDDSPTVVNVAGRSAQITLASGDDVTCTFTNKLTPPAGVLVLRKVTRDGSGAFPFTIRDSGGDVAARRTLTTRKAGGIGAVRLIKLDPGTYKVSERLPVTRNGVWHRARVTCNGERQNTGEPASVRITAGRGAVCTFTNRLDRPGQINIFDVTIGGLGAAVYLTSPVSDPGVQRRQFAQTKRQGVPAKARGQSTHELPFGRYVIQEAASVPTTGTASEWRLLAVLCNGRLRPAAQGRVTVHVSRAHPVQRCTFIHVRRPAPDPPGPTPPGPTPPGPPQPSPGGDTPDLVLDKRQVRSTGGPQPTLTFRIRVTNRSDVTATRVVIADRLPPGMALVSVKSSSGRCITRGPRLAACAVGDLAPGQSATMRVRAQQFDPDAATNVAVTGTGSPEDVLGNNIDAARVAGVHQQSPGACRSAARPTAHTAC